MASMNDPFVFSLPRGWEDQTVYVFRGPDDSGVEHSLTLMIDRHLQHDGIVSFAREKTDPITEGLLSIEVLKDEEITVEGGLPAYEFVYKLIPAGGKPILHKYVFVIRDGLGFTFAARFSRKTIKTVGLQLSEIIENLVPGTYEPLEEE